MGKLHKEMGQLIVQSAEDPEKSDSQVIQVTPYSADLLRVLKWCSWAVCTGLHVLLFIQTVAGDWKRPAGR